jgi:hypothetical protein
LDLDVEDRPVNGKSVELMEMLRSKGWEQRHQRGARRTAASTPGLGNRLAAIEAKIDRLLQQGKPKEVMSIEEAANWLGITKKHFQNTISAYKRKHKKLPDFVCDGGGQLGRRVVKEKLVAWAAEKGRKRGRPPKRG